MNWSFLFAAIGRAMDTTGQIAAIEQMERNMPITITVRHHFSAGHRIPGLPGPGAKCSNLHGHTFGVAWTFRVSGVDAAEVEFASIKKVLRGWVDQNLDHGFIVGRDDTATRDLLKSHGSKSYVTDTPPTTETLAATIAAVSSGLVNVPLTAVEVTEGPNNSARWEAV